MADQEKLRSYAAKVSQGLVAIRDSEKDGSSTSLAGSRMMRVEQINIVRKDLHASIDAEKKELLAKRKEERARNVVIDHVGSQTEVSQGWVVPSLRSVGFRPSQ